MAKFDYTRSQKTAKRLIERFGTTATLKRISKESATPNEPWAVATPPNNVEQRAIISLVFQRYNKRDIDGIRIEQGDVRALMTNQTLNFDVDFAPRVVSVTTPDMSKNWLDFSPPMWDIGANYPAGNYVKHDGGIYRSLNAVAANALSPDIDTTHWENALVGEWSKQARYRANDVVWYNVGTTDEPDIKHYRAFADLNPELKNLSTPQVDDIITRTNGDLRDYRVVDVTEFRPADDNVYYELQMRAVE